MENRRKVKKKKTTKPSVSKRVFQLPSTSSSTDSQTLVEQCAQDVTDQVIHYLKNSGVKDFKLPVSQRELEQLIFQSGASHLVHSVSHGSRKKPLHREDTEVQTSFQSSDSSSSDPSIADGDYLIEGARKPPEAIHGRSNSQMHPKQRNNSQQCIGNQQPLLDHQFSSRGGVSREEVCENVRFGEVIIIDRAQSKQQSSKQDNPSRRLEDRRRERKMKQEMQQPLVLSKKVEKKKKSSTNNSDRSYRETTSDDIPIGSSFHSKTRAENVSTHKSTSSGIKVDNRVAKSDEQTCNSSASGSPIEIRSTGEAISQSRQQPHQHHCSNHPDVHQPSACDFESQYVEQWINKYQRCGTADGNTSPHRKDELLREAIKLILFERFGDNAEILDKLLKFESQRRESVSKLLDGAIQDLRHIV